MLPLTWEGIILERLNSHSSMAGFAQQAHRDDEEWEDGSRRSPTRSRASTSNHSEIEKRRRDRMNELISELSALVPAAFKRKLDKLSVLRLALQHINSISSPVYICSTGDRELDYSGSTKHLPLSELLFLLEKCIDSFVVVTDLDSGNILYASDTVAENMSISAEEIKSRNWFDLLHPDDMQAFKNEMMTFFIESNISGDMNAGYCKFFLWLLRERLYLQTFNHLENELTGHKANLGTPTNTNAYCKFRCCGFLRKSSTPVAVLLLIKSDDEFHFRLFSDIFHTDCLAPVITISFMRVTYWMFHTITNKVYYVRLVKFAEIVQFYEDASRIRVAKHSTISCRLGGQLRAANNSVFSVVRSNEAREASYRLRCESEHCIMVDSLWRPFVNPWTSEMQFINIMHSTRSFSLEPAYWKYIVLMKKLAIVFSALRNDEELDAAQSTLKQLLSGKRGAGSSSVVPILGAARFGDSIEK
ncbi:unnamed protein product [Toxocara canis]|uniref:BHLH domain-containing protein n=1 Tax=Toxocara canis TaxID=6265 RepID=A0A183UI02_TOXCA|nr:unnamed protein product [Toxocara canis]